MCCMVENNYWYFLLGLFHYDPRFWKKIWPSTFSLPVTHEIQHSCCLVRTWFWFLSDCVQLYELIMKYTVCWYHAVRAYFVRRTNTCIFAGVQYPPSRSDPRKLCSFRRSYMHFGVNFFAGRGIQIPLSPSISYNFAVVQYPDIPHPCSEPLQRLLAVLRPTLLAV